MKAGQALAGIQDLDLRSRTIVVGSEFSIFGPDMS